MFQLISWFFFSAVKINFIKQPYLNACLLTNFKHHIYNLFINHEIFDQIKI
jgi:hypothetical protein